MHFFAQKLSYREDIQQGQQYKTKMKDESQPKEDHHSDSEPSQQLPKYQQQDNDNLRLLRNKTRVENKCQGYSKQMDYNAIASLNGFCYTTRRRQDFLLLKQFIQDPLKNILFVFGPSGCGKTRLILHSLQSSGITVEKVVEQLAYNDQGEPYYVDISRQMIQLFASSINRYKAYFFNDFPCNHSSKESAKYTAFRKNFRTYAKECRNNNKHIFVLNSEIYSAFYLLRQSDEENRIDKLNNVSTINIAPYGLREMQKIIGWMTDQLPMYSAVARHHQQEIVFQAGGDVRKAFNLIFLRKLENHQSNTRYSFKSNAKTQRVTLFHALGKFLFGKRANVLSGDPRFKNKESRNYTKEEIEKYDPPLYFQPYEVYASTHLQLQKFLFLIHENYLSKYGSTKDARQISHLFSLFDVISKDQLFFFQRDSLRRIWAELLTRGIIVYNRNSVSDNKMFRIVRSNQNLSLKLLQKKKELLKIYYLKKNGFAVREKDLVLLGQLVAQCSTRPRSWDVLKNLILCNKRLKTNTLDEGTQLIKDSEQEDGGNEIMGSLCSIEKALLSEKKKYETIQMLIMDNSDESDIE